MKSKIVVLLVQNHHLRAFLCDIISRACEISCVMNVVIQKMAGGVSLTNFVDVQKLLKCRCLIAVIILQ